MEEEEEDLSEYTLDQLFPPPSEEAALNTLSDTALKVVEADMGKPTPTYPNKKGCFYRLTRENQDHRVVIARRLRWKEILASEDPYIKELLKQSDVEYKREKRAHQALRLEWNASHRELKSERTRRSREKRQRAIEEKASKRGPKLSPMEDVLAAYKAQVDGMIQKYTEDVKKL